MLRLWARSAGDLPCGMERRHQERRHQSESVAGLANEIPCPLRIEEEAFFYDQIYRRSETRSIDAKAIPIKTKHDSHSRRSEEVKERLSKLYRGDYLYQGSWT